MEDNKDIKDQMIVLTNKMETINDIHGAVGISLRDTNHLVSNKCLRDCKKTKSKKKTKKRY